MLPILRLKTHAACEANLTGKSGIADNECIALFCLIGVAMLYGPSRYYPRGQAGGADVRGGGGGQDGEEEELEEDTV